MGSAIASAAVEAGAEVTLISGPVNIEAVGVEKIIRVTSAEEMCSSVMKKINTTDIFISAAAVSDYTFQNIMFDEVQEV